MYNLQTKNIRTLDYTYPHAKGYVWESDFHVQYNILYKLGVY